MPVITVAGTLGSRAREVGIGLADKLGFDYLDNEILVDGARRLGVSVDLMVQRDERCRSFGERVAGILRNFLEQSGSAGAVDPMAGSAGIEVLLARSYNEAASVHATGLDDRLYIDALSAVIEGLARRGNVVLVGRGSQAILREHPDAIHIAVTAPLAWRVQNVVEREGVLVEEAKRLVADFDRQRTAFHKKFFKVDPDDAGLYHLTLNAERLGIEGCVASSAAVISAHAPVAVP